MNSAALSTNISKDLEREIETNKKRGRTKEMKEGKTDKNGPFYHL